MARDKRKQTTCIPSGGHGQWSINNGKHVRGALPYTVHEGRRAVPDSSTCRANPSAPWQMLWRPRDAGRHVGRTMELELQDGVSEDRATLSGST